MNAKIFTVNFDRYKDQFDDSGMQEFLADKQLISLSDYYFEVDGLPRLVLTVTYRNDVKEFEGKVVKKQRKDWACDLDDAEKNTYNALRLWRNHRAEAEGKPAYVLFSNRQLVEIAAIRPTTLADMAKVSGVGTSRLQDYGAEVLRIVKEFSV